MIRGLSSRVVKVNSQRFGFIGFNPFDFSHGTTFILSEDVGQCLFCENRNVEWLRVTDMTNITDSDPYDVLFSAALEAEKRGLFAHADRLMAKIIETNHRKGIANSQNYIGMLLQFADLCADGERLEKADSVYREVLSILIETKGIDHLSTGLAMRSLADVCSRLGKFDEAAEISNTASSILSKNHQKKNSAQQAN